MTKPIAPVVEVDDSKPSDMKEFTPSNPKMDEMNLSPDHLARREASEKKEAEDSAREKAEDIIDKGDDTSKPDHDHKIPDDGFGIESPLDLGTHPKKTVEKPEDKKPEVETEEKKEQNSAFRQQVEDANHRAKESDLRVDAANNEIETLKSQVSQMEAGMKDAQERLAFKDPSEHPQVQAMLDPWDRELDLLAQQISLNGGKGSKLKIEAKELIGQFKELGSPESEGFEDRREALIERIDKDFPDDRKEIVSMMSRGVSVFGEAENLMRDIRENGSKFQQEESNKIYEVIVQDYKDAEKNFFNPSQELRDTDPLNARVLMADMAKASEPIRERISKIKTFSRFGLNPLPPVNPDELRGMDDAAAASYLEQRRVQHTVAQRSIRESFPEARMALTLLPVLSKELAEAKALIREIREANPKLSDKQGDEENREEDEPTDEERREGIKSFDPGPVNIDLN